MRIGLPRGVAALLASLLLALFGAAAPAFADGGPHVAGDLSGFSTLTSDLCASCHRAHTAQSAFLGAEAPPAGPTSAPSALGPTAEVPIPALPASPDQVCLMCHGSAGVGATTDVTSGIQYKAAVAPGGTAQDPTDAGVVAGALRGGGFVTARIDSTHPTRISYPKYDGTILRVVADFSSKVPVLAAGQPVTSAHIALTDATGVTAQGRAWGNSAEGTFSATAFAGPAVTLWCTSCHNPHGNGHYRILNPLPTLDASGADPFVAPVTEAEVTDAALPAAGQTRNYTVKPGVLLTDVSSTPPTDGDYWRRREPWDWVPSYSTTNPLRDSHNIVPAPSGGGHTGDRPNNLVTFSAEISTWCATCHTRYLAGGDGPTTSSGDAVYGYRHATTGAVPCTACHVSHGSNALMTGPNSSTVAYPDGTVSASSRLLKVDERGTCQQCHDPTGTEPYAPNTVRP